jgi:hypothetical protein
VYTTWSLYRAAAEVTGKHWSRCINNGNNVTVEHRVVVSTEDEVTVLETRAVITNTPVKYIILFGVAMLVHKTWKQHIIMGLLPRKLARVIRLLNYNQDYFGSCIGGDICYADGGSVTFLSLSSGMQGQFFEIGHDSILRRLFKSVMHEIFFHSTLRI